VPEIHKAAAVGASIILACKMPHYLNFVQSVDCHELVLDSQLSPRSSTKSKPPCYHRRFVLEGKNGLLSELGECIIRIFGALA
jgi:hypothetical protein